MIDVQRQRIEYRDVLILTVDEEGVRDLRTALAALQRSVAVRAAEIKVSEGSERLTLIFEAKKDREQREAEEAAKEAARKAERDRAARKAERDRRAAGQPAEGGH
jgi:hypothetical protein